MFSEICQSTPGFSLNFVNLPQDGLWTSSIYPKSFSEFVNLPEDFLWKSSIYPQSFSEFRQSTPRFSLNFVNLPQGFLWTSSIDPKVFFSEFRQATPGFFNFANLPRDFLGIAAIYPRILSEIRQLTPDVILLVVFSFLFRCCLHLFSSYFMFFCFSIFLVLFFLFPTPSLFSLLFICHVLVFCVLVGSYVFCFIYLFLCLSSCCRRAGKMTREEREAALGRERKPGPKIVLSWGRGLPRDRNADKGRKGSWTGEETQSPAPTQD